MTSHLLETTDPDFAPLSLDVRRAIERGLVGAVAHHGKLTRTQRRILRAIGSSILGIDFDVEHETAATAEELAQALHDQPEPIRHRVVQFMMVLELILDPLPREVAERVETYAEALQVQDDLLGIGREYAEQAFGLALKDLDRNGYFHDFDDHGDLEKRLHVSSHLTEPFEHVEHDETLLAAWQSLRDLPEGSLGRATWRFYASRGFPFPGSPGSVAPSLAQHDFVHVLAGYGATMEGEIETFAFISAANPDPHGFSWLATVLGVFETGYVPTAAGGVLEADRGHLDDEGMCIRLADALRRGRPVQRDLVGGVDWFELAPLSLDEVRRQLGVPPKSEAATRAGSADVDERGGYSTWQIEHGDAALQRWRAADASS
ncbi:MAG: ubiquinone biosynthesis protein COQ4 [Myxococcales bacterium]|nr:ubiquinone biosynthesis protein COQ4 [Myxococcales bacterium]